MFLLIWNYLYLRFVLIQTMEILQKKKLLKLASKNIGNTKLIKAINDLIESIEEANWKSELELVESRTDADCVHNDGFYFFDINIHRTMILMLFDDSEAEIMWVGTHDEYKRIFKSNKRTIERWLRNQGKIK